MNWTQREYSMELKERLQALQFGLRACGIKSSLEEIEMTIRLYGALEKNPNLDFASISCTYTEVHKKYKPKPVIIPR